VEITPHLPAPHTEPHRAFSFQFLLFFLSETILQTLFASMQLAIASLLFLTFATTLLALPAERNRKLPAERDRKLPAERNRKLPTEHNRSYLTRRPRRLSTEPPPNSPVKWDSKLALRPEERAAHQETLKKWEAFLHPSQQSQPPRSSSSTGDNV